MHTVRKRLLAILLTLAMVVSLFPVSAFADAGEDEGSIAPVTEDAPATEPAPAEEARGSISPAGEAPEALPEEPVTDEVKDTVASGECGDNLTWTLENGVLTISGTGEMTEFDSTEDIPWYNSRYGITSLMVESGVTSIASKAFYGFVSLKNVTLPASITSVGRKAFYNCANVKIVYIEDLFWWLSLENDDMDDLPHGTIILNGEAITDLVIPEGVKKVRRYAFYRDAALTSVTIPSGVEALGNLAFVECDNLTVVTMPSTVRAIEGSVFDDRPMSELHIQDFSWWITANFGPFSAPPTGNMYIGEELLEHAVIPEGTTRIRPSAFADCSELKSVVIPESMTSIGPYAFYRCSGLTSIRLPDSVTNLSEDAFEGCSSLTEVRLPATLTFLDTRLFRACSSLREIAIPESVTRIGGGAFSDCSSLVSVTIPESVTRIGGGAFSGCSSLVSMTIPAGVTSIGSGAFAWCSSLTSIAIPEGVTDIGDSAFALCSSLTSIVIPEGVTDIGQHVFENCSSLVSVTIPAGVTSIGNYAFSGCRSLTSVVIPEGVTSVGNYAFSGCQSLTSLAIPEGVTDIGDLAFSFCQSLTSVTIPESVTSVGNNAFGACDAVREIYVDSLDWWLSFHEAGRRDLPHGELFIQGKLLTEAVIPEGETTLRVGAFWGCKRLTSVTLPEDLTKIGDHAFCDCRSLESVTIPAGVTAIEANSFSGCTCLKEVTIPAGVTAIGYQAFHMSGLETIVFLGDAPEIGGEAFSGGYPEEDGSFHQLRVVALYPADNTTWIAELIQNFHFLNMTWVGYRDEPLYYTVSFDANGGDHAPAARLKGHHVDLTLDVDAPTLENYEFLGWSADSEASEAEYASGASYCQDADVILYAVWKPIAYTVSYDANGGEGAPEAQTKFHDVTLLLSETEPTREGYDFLGWSTDPARTGGSDFQPGSEYIWNGDIILYAVWAIKWYTIRYDANGGNSAPEEQIKTYHEDLVLSSDVPWRYGYSFLGWSADQEATEPQYLPGDIYRINENVTLYAVWNPLAYPVFYDANGGDGAPEAQAKIHDVTLILSETAPSREGYSFLGWATDPNAGRIDYYPGGEYTENAELTLYAVWQIKSFAIRYDANGGDSVPACQFKNYGEDLVLSSDVPSRYGHSFLGWARDPEASEPEYFPGDLYSANADLTLYALWQINTYTISYDANGGSEAPEAQTKIHDVDLTLSEKVPTREGHSFLGWARSPEASLWYNFAPGAVYRDNASVTLYAVWRSNTYHVYLNWNGGTSGPSHLIKEHGQDLLLEGSCYREGYVFLGWARDPRATEAEFAPNSYFYDNVDTTLFAVWQIYTYPVRYIVGKNVQGPDSTVKTWNVDLVLSDMVPTAEGYEFMGWSTSSQGAIPDYQPGDTYRENGSENGSEILFYAVWRLRSYLVIYRSDGYVNSMPDPQFKLHGRALQLSETVPGRPGYVFLGWSTERSAAQVRYRPGDSFTENADTVLYAVWQRTDHSAETGPLLSLMDVTGCIGREFTMALTLEKNPGLMFLSFSLDYEDAALEFIGAEDGVFSDWIVTPGENSLVWDSDRNHTENGTLLRLRFRVKDGIEPGVASVRIMDLFAADYDEQKLQIETDLGLVTLAERHPGDITGDGEVDGLDLIRLRKWLVNVPETEFLEPNADVNGDGQIDVLDLVRLRKWLAKDDVILE